MKTALTADEVHNKYCTIQYGEHTVIRKLKAVGTNTVEWNYGWCELHQIESRNGKLFHKHY